MNEMKVLDVAHAVGSSKLLGLLAGKQAREALLAAIPVGRAEEALLLDLSGMELITASAARESVVYVSRQMAESGTPVVLTNVNDECRDELAFAAEAAKVPLLVADQVIDGKPVHGRLIGFLDTKQLETLEVVARLGEADAKKACEAAGDANAGVTAWNNRLAGLASKGLLRERRAGKTKFFSLALEGITDGH